MGAQAETQRPQCGGMGFSPPPGSPGQEVDFLSMFRQEQLSDERPVTQRLLVTQRHRTFASMVITVCDSLSCLETCVLQYTSHQPQRTQH